MILLPPRCHQDQGPAAVSGNGPLTCNFLVRGQDFYLRPLGYERSLASFNPVWH